MRQLCAKLDTMETTQIRALEVRDVSEDESEYVEEEEVAREQATKEQLLRAIVKLGTRANMEVSMYEVNLNV
jgi:hypothetical protein